MLELGLKDKVAIITGGSDGLGRASALKLAEEGARVAIAARRADHLERAAAEIRAATGADVLGHPAEALALAVNDLADRGLALEAGWVVLTGGMSDAVYATPGSTVTCRFATLGDVVLACGRPD